MHRYAIEAQRLLFKSHSAYRPPPIPLERKTTPNLIIMSHVTAHYILWSQEDGEDFFRRGLDGSVPDTIFGIRVAYDDSLREGEMKVGVLLKSS